MTLGTGFALSVGRANLRMCALYCTVWGSQDFTLWGATEAAGRVTEQAVGELAWREALTLWRGRAGR